MERMMTSLLLFAAILYFAEARTLAFGMPSAPKSGFLPMLAGIIAILLAVVLLFQTKKKTAEQERKEPVNWVKFNFIWVGMVFYVTMIGTIGFFLSTWILLIYLFKVADTEGWFVPTVVGAVTSVSFYFLFVKYLLVPLP